MELGLLGSVFNLSPSKGSPENIGSKVGVYPGDQASFCAVFSKLLCHFPQSFFLSTFPEGCVYRCRTWQVLPWAGYKDEWVVTQASRLSQIGEGGNYSALIKRITEMQTECYMNKELDSQQKWPLSRHGTTCVEQGWWRWEVPKRCFGNTWERAGVA